MGKIINSLAGDWMSKCRLSVLVKFISIMTVDISEDILAISG